MRLFGPENLYEKINGEAPKFLLQGFERLDYLVLRQKDLEISIELYKFNKKGGSMGLFSDHVPMNREIKERSGVIYFLTSIGAIGRVNRFFFRLLGSSKHEEIEKKTQQILNVFNQFSPLQNSTENID